MKRKVFTKDVLIEEGDGDYLTIHIFLTFFCSLDAIYLNLCTFRIFCSHLPVTQKKSNKN